MDTSSKRVVEPVVSDTEERVHQSLRAEKWDEFVGQEKVKKALRLGIDATKKRGEVLEHVLLYGPPGLGKTTLAHILAKDMGVSIRVTSGPALERAGDLASILTNLEEGDVLFIDEIHRLNKAVEETIYPAMEDFAIDVILGKGPAARTLRLDLPRFTLVGATTQAGKLSAPLRDRFGHIYRMDFYDDAELSQMIDTACAKLSIEIEKKASMKLAGRSRKTGRIALKLLKRVRDFSEVEGDGIITEAMVDGALKLLEVDELGLDAHDRRVLLAIIEKYDGGPVGLSTLAAATAEDVATIEDVYEPFLLRIGMIKRTSRGRMVTNLAYKHLGFKKRIVEEQESLLD